MNTPSKRAERVQRVLGVPAADAVRYAEAIERAAEIQVGHYEGAEVIYPVNEMDLLLVSLLGPIWTLHIDDEEGKPGRLLTTTVTTLFNDDTPVERALIIRYPDSCASIVDANTLYMKVEDHEHGDDLGLMHLSDIDAKGSVFDMVEQITDAMYQYLDRLPGRHIEVMVIDPMTN